MKQRELITFNRPICLEQSVAYMDDAARRGEIRGDFRYCHKCGAWMEHRFGAKKVLLTTSGSDALEMAALLCDIQPGDEVILPSFTFSSTANAFVLRGARLVFVDIRPDTMNIDEQLIEAAITPRTRGIVPGGIICLSWRMPHRPSWGRTKGVRLAQSETSAAILFMKQKITAWVRAVLSSSIIQPILSAPRFFAKRGRIVHSFCKVM